MARNVSDAKDAIVAVATERGIVNLRWRNLLFYHASCCVFFEPGVACQTIVISTLRAIVAVW